MKHVTSKLCHSVNVLKILPRTTTFWEVFRVIWQMCGKIRPTIIFLIQTVAYSKKSHDLESLCHDLWLFC